MFVIRNHQVRAYAALVLLALATGSAVSHFARQAEPGRAATITVDDSLYATRNVHNGSSPTVVFTSDQVGYAFYVDADGTCVYNKTVDGGATWAGAVAIDPDPDCIRVAAWYDGWTPGDAGTVIHVAIIDTGFDDLFYTALDTATDTLSSTVNATDANQTNAFTINKSLPSITKGTDGDLYMGIQDVDDSFVIKCEADCDAQTNWVEAGANPFDLTNDWLILMPLAGADVLAIRWDISAGAVQSKAYDDATDAWDGAWTDIDPAAPVDVEYDAPFGATLDPDTGDVYLAYAAQTDVLGGDDDDVRTATYSGGAWTAGADALIDDAKGVTGVKLAFDGLGGRLYALYTAQATPGTPSSANVYYKVSSDGMASWGSEQGPLNANDKNFFGARVNLLSDERLYFTAFVAGSDNLLGGTLANIGRSGGSSLPAVSLLKPGITVISPNGGEALEPGAVPVEWTTQGRVDLVNVEYSLDDGATWMPIAREVPNAGVRTWVVPEEATRSARVRVEATDTVVTYASDASDAPFAILGSQPVAPGTLVASPFSGFPEAVDPVSIGEYVRSPHYRGMFFVDDRFIRRPFPDARTFFTYEDDVGLVKEVTDSTLSTLPLGRPMPPDPGSVLIVFDHVPRVYALFAASSATADPWLRRIESLPVAEAMYGQDWEQFILPLDPSLFHAFQLAAPILSPEPIDASKLKTAASLEDKVARFLSALVKAGYQENGRVSRGR
ncbi:hypothetical protein A2856_01525 [Candidatus Uhrbacteria bacterium RIFCSPHIGHO2_01_FULL_63_20]|uniref:Sialidase domain-containing protein n=1 Tax=Candidatus Uhrbacteria bacterium RIFCSPHIGHO2_01_FULL_63_20 TaxID=1802385 RepID=A0A1F7TK65_9BACT|nr:MAG: hypothetical protein A2856_01525 [Candidatus Uhrbacteria bacterium RIFCSPHIGHO2_01_FULL_63_20]